MDNAVYTGLLRTLDGVFFLQGADGRRYLEGEKIWSGYLRHFIGKNVFARRLPQKDYETGRPIVLMWPCDPEPADSFIELYFNERLTKYPISLLGHLAVNVDGEIFNFSHLMNENEVLRPEDYFYRPALGEFAPHPVSGKADLDDPEKPYYDKFGRRFMRTIHILKVTGLDTRALSDIFHHELESIRRFPRNPKKAEHYAGFNVFTRSCSSIIRDGFRKVEFKKIHGVFPRDLFVRTADFFMNQSNDPSIKAVLFTLNQLSVSEAPQSAMPPLMNPLNYYRNCRLRRRKIEEPQSGK